MRENSSGPPPAPPSPTPGPPTVSMPTRHLSSRPLPGPPEVLRMDRKERAWGVPHTGLLILLLTLIVLDLNSL